MRKVFLIVSIDTECDKGPGWKIQSPMSFRNITDGIPNVLTPLFQEYDIKPTYLLSPEVIHDLGCVSALGSVVSKELGTHLHEEFVEPFARWDASRTSSVQCDLDSRVEEQKLVRLTQLFKSAFGHNPISFRAGRFGISRHTWKFLEELGYKVDSSVTPFKTHYYETGSTNNFWGYRYFPYQVPNTRLVQVPVTIVNNEFMSLPFWILRTLEDRRTLSRRVLGRLGFRSKSEWFRPYRSTSETLVRIAERAILATPGKRYPVLNMMFHSNEIIPGGSPYCQTPKEVAEYVAALAETFKHLKSKYEVCSIGLGEYAEHFQ